RLLPLPGAHPPEAPDADEEHPRPGRMGDRADLLRHVRAALHLRGLRGLPVPRRQRSCGVRPAADAARASAALPGVGIPRRPRRVHPHRDGVRREHARRASDGIAVGTGSARARPARILLLAARGADAGGGAAVSPRLPRARRPGVVSRLWWVAGELLARDTMVITNAIAFNFLLCLFPLVLVLVAVSQQLPGRRVSTSLLLVLNELIPFEREAMAVSLEGLRKVARGLEVVSVLLIVWGSSGIFMPVELALSRAWGGQARGFWRSRALAVLMTVAGGLLAILSVTVTVAARAYSREWPTVS